MYVGNVEPMKEFFLKCLRFVTARSKEIRHKTEEEDKRIKCYYGMNQTDRKKICPDGMTVAGAIAKYNIYRFYRVHKNFYHFTPNTHCSLVVALLGKKQVPFSMAIGNVKLVQEWFSKHSRMGTARMK